MSSDPELSDSQRARQRRHRAMVTGEVSPPHGEYGTYTNYVCRCTPCRKANLAYQTQRNAAARAAKEEEAS